MPPPLYGAIYAGITLVGWVYARSVLRINNRRFWMATWLGVAILGSLLALGIFLGSLLFTDRRVIFSVALGFTTLLSAFSRLPKSEEKLKEAESVIEKLRVACQASVLWISASVVLRQYTQPRFAWDEVAVWVPKMKSLYEGVFADLVHTAIPSYPPLWPIIGSWALNIDSMMLYLLPVFLFTLGGLAAVDWLSERFAVKESCIIFLFCLPAFLGVAQEIQAFSLYANFPLLLVFTTLYWHRSHRAILASAAVLLRTDAIFPVLCLALAELIIERHSWRRTILWIVPPLFFYVLWFVWKLEHSVIDEIARFSWQGVQELLNHQTSLTNKASNILIFAAKQMWWSRVYWYIPVFVFFTLVNRRWNKWTLFLLFHSVFVFIQYLTVPVTGGAGIEWWLGTGWTRMISVGQYILLFELIELTAIRIRRHKNE